MKKVVIILIFVMGLFFTGCPLSLEVETAVEFAKVCYKYRETVIIGHPDLDLDQKKSMLLPLYQSQGITDKEIEERFALLTKYGADEVAEKLLEELDKEKE